MSSKTKKRKTKRPPFSWGLCPHPGVLAVNKFGGALPEESHAEDLYCRAVADFELFSASEVPFLPAGYSGNPPTLPLSGVGGGGGCCSSSSSSSSSGESSTNGARKKAKGAAAAAPSAVSLPADDIEEPLFTAAELKKIIRRPKQYRALDATGNYYRGSKGTLTARPTVLANSEWPTCTCEPSESGCGPDCINRQLFMECRLGGCEGRLGDASNCGNTACQTRRFPASKVVLTEGCGWGLKICEAVPRGTPIIEYCGEVITVDTCRERLSSLVRKCLIISTISPLDPCSTEPFAHHSSRSPSVHASPFCSPPNVRVFFPATTKIKLKVLGEDFYFASLDRELVLDAAPMGSNARFANHSCNPNCDLQKWVVGGVPRVVLVSARALTVGEHCTYNYHADTMGGLVKRQPCLCGAPNCSGFIGGKVTQTTDNEWIFQAEKLLGQAKPKLESLQALEERAGELGVYDGLPELNQIRELIRGGEAWVTTYEKALADAEVRFETNKRKKELQSKKTSTSKRQLSARAAEAAAPVDGEQDENPTGKSPPDDPDVASPMEISDAGSATNGLKTIPLTRDGEGPSSDTFPSAISSVDPYFTPSDIEALLASIPSTVRLSEASAFRDKLTRAEQLKRQIARMCPSSSPPFSVLEEQAPSSSFPLSLTSSSAPPPPPSSASSSSSTLVSSSSLVSYLPSTKSNGRKKGRSSAEEEEIPHDERPTMKQVNRTLEGVEACFPVRVDGAERLHNLLANVESWAEDACKQLMLKRKPLTKIEKEAVARGEPDPRGSTTFLELLTSELEPVIGLGFEYEEQRNLGADLINDKKHKKSGDHCRKKKTDGTTASGNGRDGSTTAIEPAGALDHGNPGVLGLDKMKHDDGDETSFSSSDEDGEVEFCEFASDEEHESDGDPDAVHCLCRLRESSTKSTMVNCDACHKWYHLTCVNKLAKSLGRSKANARGFICPICQHRRGVPSELACRPPSTSRRIGKFSRVPLSTISAVLATGRILPVTAIPCVNFLACLADNANEWKRRSEAAIEKHELRLLHGNLNRSLTVADPTDPSVWECSSFGAPPSNTSSTPPEVQKLPLRYLSNEKRLKRGVAMIQELSQLITEGRDALQVDVADEITALRKVIWREVAGTIPRFQHLVRDYETTRTEKRGVDASQGNAADSAANLLVHGRHMWRHWVPVHSSPLDDVDDKARAAGPDLERINRKQQHVVTFDMLENIIDWGAMLGLREEADPCFKFLENAQRQVKQWLVSAETNAFDSVSLLSIAVPRSPSITLESSLSLCLPLPIPHMNLSGEVGFRRLLAALLNDSKRETPSFAARAVMAAAPVNNGNHKKADMQVEQVLSPNNHVLNSIDHSTSTSAPAGIFPGQTPSAAVVNVPSEEQVDMSSYCICRGLDDGTFMYECEDCLEWFHADCLGLRPPPKRPASSKRAKTAEGSCESASDESNVFICPVCAERTKVVEQPALNLIATNTSLVPSIMPPDGFVAHSESVRTNASVVSTSTAADTTIVTSSKVNHSAANHEFIRPSNVPTAALSSSTTFSSSSLSSSSSPPPPLPILDKNSSAISGAQGVKRRSSKSLTTESYDSESSEVSGSGANKDAADVPESVATEKMNQLEHLVRNHPATLQAISDLKNGLSTVLDPGAILALPNWSATAAGYSCVAKTYESQVGKRYVVVGPGGGPQFRSLPVAAAYCLRKAGLDVEAPQPKRKRAKETTPQFVGSYQQYRPVHQYPPGGGIPSGGMYGSTPAADQPYGMYQYQSQYQHPQEYTHHATPAPQSIAGPLPLPISYPPQQQDQAFYGDHDGQRHSNPIQGADGGMMSALHIICAAAAAKQEEEDAKYNAGAPVIPAPAPPPGATSAAAAVNLHDLVPSVSNGW